MGHRKKEPQTRRLPEGKRCLKMPSSSKPASLEFGLSPGLISPLDARMPRLHDGATKEESGARKRRRRRHRQRVCKAFARSTASTTSRLPQGQPAPHNQKSPSLENSRRPCPNLPVHAAQEASDTTPRAPHHRTLHRRAPHLRD